MSTRSPEPQEQTPQGQTPQAPVEPRLHLEGTAQDRDSVSLPPAQSAEQQRRHLVTYFGAVQGNTLHTQLEQTAALQAEVSTHAHFFTAEEFSTIGRRLSSLNQDLARSLQSGDTNRYRSLLRELDTYLRGLKSFVDYEKSQGLIGTCTDCGVRLYMHGEKVWLCTPDQQSFQDLTQEQQSQLRNFVRGLTGVTVDLDQMRLQEQRQSGDRTFLGCRLDALQLLDLEAEQKYEVLTHVRDRGTFAERTIRFSLEDLRRGAVPGLMGHPAALPDVRAHIAQSAPATQTDAREVARVGTVPLRTLPLVAAAPALQTRPAVPRQLPEETPRGQLPPEQRALVDALDERRALQQRLRNGLHNVDAADELLRRLNDLDGTQSAFNDAVTQRREFLRAEVERHPWNSPEHSRAVQMLDDLDQLWAEDTLLRKDVLMRQLEHGDEATKASARRSLITHADDISAAYEKALTRTGLSTAESEALQTSRTAFSERITALKASRFQVVNYLRTQGQRLMDLGSRLRSWGNTRLSIPGRESAWQYLRGRTPAQLLSRAEAVTSLVSSTDVGTLGSAERATQLRQLSQHSDAFRERITTLERGTRSGSTPAPSDLQQLKEADARCTIRRAELMRAELADISDPIKHAEIQRALHDMLGEVETSYRFLGNDSGFDDFQRQMQSEAARDLREARIAAEMADPEVAAANARRLAVERALSDATAGTPEHVELTKARDLARLAEDIAVDESRLTRLEQQYAADADNTGLRSEIDTLRDKLHRSRELQAQRKVNLAQTRVDNVSQRLSQIEQRLAELNVPLDEQNTLRSEQRGLEQRKLELTAELEQARVGGASTHIQLEINELKSSIASAKAELQSTNDAARKTQLEADIARMERDVLTKEAQLIENELRSAQRLRTQLTQTISELDARIAEHQANGNVAELEECQKLKRQLEHRSRALQTTEEYMTGQRELIELEKRTAGLERGRRNLQSRLEEVRRTGTPDEALAVERSLQTLEQELSQSRTSLTAQQQRFRQSWGQRLAAARRTFETRVLGQLEDMATRHPLKTATMVGAITEGFRAMTQASYEDDARHTYIPGLLCLLDSDLEDGFFGLPAEFTTAQLGGQWGARPMEFVSGAGNVAVIMTGFAGVQKLAPVISTRVIGQKATERIGAALGTKIVGRSLSFVGAGVDGFLTFSDYNTWMNATDEQLFGKTASPVVTGAAFGAFFGPPGAVLGAFGGALGEAGGVVYACYQLDADIANDWRKRGVRDTIRLAQEGFVYREGHSTPRNRSRQLADWEEEAIGDLLKGHMMGLLFGQNSPYSRSELQSMGFKLGNSNSDAAHNLELLEDLMGPARYRWAVRDSWHVWESESYKLLDRNSGLWHKLHNDRNRIDGMLRDLYNDGPRISYRNEQRVSTIELLWTSETNYGRVHKNSELGSFMSEVSRHYHQEMRTALARLEEQGVSREQAREQLAELQWQILAEKVPQIGLILSDQGSRELFLNNFEGGGEGFAIREQEFWKYRTLCPTGLAWVTRYQPQDMREMGRVALSTPLSEVDGIISDLVQ